MTDRTLPHASDVTNRAVAELTMHGETELAQQLAHVAHATVELVQGVHAEREAPTHSLQQDARSKIANAIARLRGRQPA